MFLRIQSEESLRSFVERNIYLNWKYPSVKIFERLSKFSLKTHDVGIIAAAMGWPGCYGFNRLLHHHTHYPKISIVKDIKDIAYSGREYISISNCFGSDRDVAAFCPACVKNDLEILGFSYWRRLHQEKSLNVCVKHNVLLVRSCPFCSKPFSYQGHGLDVMWKKCEGRHLAECVPVHNEDANELKKSNFHEDINSFGFHVSQEAAVCVLHDKLLSIRQDVSLQVDRIDGYIRRLKSRKGRLYPIFSKVYSGLDCCSDDFFFEEVIQFLYDSFYDFVFDIKNYGHEFRAVESLWSTYRAGGSESAQFVDEDYLFGVGRWSCPYPASISSWYRSNDGYIARTPKIYPCCNFKPKKHKGHQLKAEWAPAPPPRIPIFDVKKIR